MHVSSDGWSMIVCPCCDNSSLKQLIAMVRAWFERDVLQRAARRTWQFKWEESSKCHAATLWTNDHQSWRGNQAWQRRAKPTEDWRELMLATAFMTPYWMEAKPSNYRTGAAC
jgi:hypothetical protein